ncbi:putative dioxygenase [Dishui Lake phycodnavirus 2]|nr:putative dioxygenase [Dishui Lake phycodnavirus 2]
MHNNIYLLKHVVSDDMCTKLVKIIDSEAVYQEKVEKGRYNVQCTYVPAHLLKDTRLCVYVQNVFSEISRLMYAKTNLKTTKCGGVTLRKIHGKTTYHQDGPYDFNLVENHKIDVTDIRKFSVIVALNEDYEGGELYFKMQDAEFKLQRGEALIFPPYWTHPHETRDLRNGTYRYTLNGWLTG